VSRWQAATAFALVGEVLELTEPGGPDVDRLVVGLAAAGWPASRIAELAGAELVAERVWPFPVPADLREGLGAAQFAAALAAARRALGVADLVVRVRGGRTRLTADELRLLADVPPHHGS
jgi:hypothetical protein